MPLKGTAGVTDHEKAIWRRDFINYRLLAPEAIIEITWLSVKVLESGQIGHKFPGPHCPRCVTFVLLVTISVSQLLHMGDGDTTISQSESWQRWNKSTHGKTFSPVHSKHSAHNSCYEKVNQGCDSGPLDVTGAHTTGPSHLLLCSHSKLTIPERPPITLTSFSTSDCFHHH